MDNYDTFEAEMVPSRARRTLPYTRAGSQDDVSYTNSLKLGLNRIRAIIIRIKAIINRIRAIMLDARSERVAD